MPMPLSTYPAQIDNSNSLPQVVDNLTPVQGSVFNSLRNAVLAIEATLGTTPNGLYNTVGARLTTLEGLIAQVPIIQITQDLGGTPDSPLVIGIQGRPVSDAAPTSGQSLVWNGIAWIPSTVSGGGGGTVFGGDLQGLSGFQTVIGLQNHPISSTAPTTGQVLEYNGTQWAPGSGGFTAGGDLSGNSTSQTVVGIRNHSVPSPFGTNTFLEWTGSAFTWAAGGGGGGNLTGDVNGPSSSNVVTHVQGALAQLPQNSGPQLGTTNVPSVQPNGAITAVPMTGATVSAIFDANSNAVWFAPINQSFSQSFTPFVNVVDVSTLQVKAQINVPHFFRASGAEIRTIIGDPTTNFVYISAPPNSTSNLVAIVDRTIFQVVGYLSVGSTVTAVTGYDGTVTINSLNGGSLNVASTTGFPGSGTIFVMTQTGQANVSYSSTTPTSFVGLNLVSGGGFIFPGGEVVQSGQGKARSIAPDLSGNIWVTDNNNDTVSKFLAADIAAAITNFPVPQPPSGPVVTGLTPSAETCCWDPTTGTLFVGGISNPHSLFQISSSGVLLQTNNTFTTSNWFGYHGIVSYQGFLWASSDGSVVLQIDPTVFSNTNAGYTTISTPTAFSGDVSIDTFNQCVLFQDQRFGNSAINPVISRVSAPGGVVTSSITLPYTTISSLSGGLALPQSTINVVSTTGFPPNGIIYVQTDAGTQVITYSGLSGGTQFIGCVGGIGNMTTANNVSIGSVNQNHGWITPVAASADLLFIGDQNTLLGAYLYTNTPGSETFQQHFQPGILTYTSTIYQSAGQALGWNSNFPSSPLAGIPPIRYFNVTGTGFTFTEQVGSDGNLAAVLNLSGGGGGSLVVENQGGSLGSGFTNLNFTGVGVTASGSPPNATISIPGFTAAGDLTGSNTSQTVVGIQGVAINGTAPTTGQVLTATGPSNAGWQTPSGGGGYATIQQNGTPLTQRNTLNFPTGVSITDDNANSRTTVNLVLTDNNAAGRTRNLKNLRSNGFTGNQYGDVFSVIGAHLQTGGYAPSYGRSICSIGDNVYFTGYDGTNYGALYGINSYTNTSLSAAATPIHVYNTFNPGVHQDGPMALISYRSNVQNAFEGGSLSGNFDYIFAGGSYNGTSNSTFIELGYLTNGGSTYNQVYRNDAFGFNGPIYWAAPLGSKPLTTTIAAGSNNVSLPQPIINVAATFRFPSSGQIYVITANGVQIVSYTGTSGGNQFTGCTGGTGQMTTGNAVSLTPEYNHPFFALIDHSLHLYVIDGAGNISLPLSTTNFFELAVDDEGGLWTISSPSAVLERYTYDLSTYLTPFTLTASLNLHSGPNSFSQGISILISDGRYMWGVSPNSDPNGQAWVYQIDTHTAAFTGVFFPVSLDTYMAESEHNIAWDGEALWFSTISFNANWIKMYKIHPKTGEVLWVSPIINNLAHLGFGTVGGLTVMDNGDVFMGYADYSTSFGPTLYLYRASKNANSVHAHSLTLDVPLTSGFQVGSLTLSGGTFTVNTGITINNVNTTKILLTPTTSAVISGGVRYTVTSKVAGGPGVGAFTVEAIGSSGSIVSDASVLDYVILG